MAVVTVGQRRTVGITGTDVGFVSRAGALNGMGDCSPAGTDEYGELCAYIPPNVDTSAANAYINNPNISTGLLPGTVQSQPSNSGINWNSLFGNLIGAGTKLGTQQLATPGTTILPNGTVVTGTPQGTSALATGLGSSTGLIMIAGLGLVGLMLMLGRGR